MLFDIGNYKKEIPMTGNVYIVHKGKAIVMNFTIYIQAINKNCTKENTKLGIVAKRSKNCTRETEKQPR